MVGGGFHGEVEQRECDAARTVPNRRPCDFGLIRASVRTHSGARVRRDARMLGKARERSIILRPVGSIVAKIGAGSLHVMLVKCTYPVLLGARRHSGDILERVVMKKNSRQKWWPTAGCMESKSPRTHSVRRTARAAWLNQKPPSEDPKIKRRPRARRKSKALRDPYENQNGQDENQKNPFTT